MFIFKRKPLLTEYYLEELREQVGRTVEVMLIDKEETILFYEKLRPYPDILLGE